MHRVIKEELLGHDSVQGEESNQIYFIRFKVDDNDHDEQMLNSQHYYTTNNLAFDENHQVKIF